MVRGTKDKNGVESFAKLANQCDPKSDTSELNRLIRIIQWDFSDAAKLSEQIISFKEEVCKYEEIEDFILPDRLKVAVLCKNGPEILSDHIRLHAAKKSFQEVEDIALTFIRSKGLAGDPSAMEVDAIYTKGKHKGKGK